MHLFLLSSPVWYPHYIENILQHKQIPLRVVDIHECVLYARKKNWKDTCWVSFLTKSYKFKNVTFSIVDLWKYSKYETTFLSVLHRVEKGNWEITKGNSSLSKGTHRLRVLNSSLHFKWLFIIIEECSMYITLFSNFWYKIISLLIIC